MPDKPLLHMQETTYSCVPACLRMVLTSVGVSKTEQELRVLCDCTYDSPLMPGGTDPFKLKIAAQTLGFANTLIGNLTVDELKSELARGLYPIAYLKAKLASGMPPQFHAVVVIEMIETDVEVLDPWRGELVLSLEDFLTEWTRGTTVVVER
ncbi:MAG: cysteine peptidase family C39 domain-containing protein [Acidobacteriota bacterium]